MRLRTISLVSGEKLQSRHVAEVALHRDGPGVAHAAHELHARAA